MDLHAQTGITPVPTLKTARLTLRTMQAADGPVVVDALNNWDVTQWLTTVPFPYSDADFTHFLKEMCSYPDDRIWAMEKHGHVTGVISLTAELGYWLHPNHHGRGLMSEAARAVCAWYFADTDQELKSGYHLGNGPSCAVLTKLGFENTHIDHNVETARGDRVDIQRMALTKTRWASHA